MRNYLDERRWAIYFNSSFLPPYSKNERNSMEDRVRWRVFLCVKVTTYVSKMSWDSQDKPAQVLGRTSTRKRVSMRLSFLPSILDTLSWLSILSFFEFLLVFEICAWCSGQVLTRHAAGRPLFKTGPTVLLCRKAPTLLQPLPPCRFGISPTWQSEMSTTGQLPSSSNIMKPIC